jgi:flagellar L-ring protein precursor FlgH
MKIITLLVKIIIVFCFVVLSIHLLAQEYNTRRFENVRQRSLISDFKAMGIGDAVKVLIVEETEAGNSAGTTEARNSNLSASIGAGYTGGSISADATLGTGNTFDGKGANTRKETIRSQLTARVIGEDDRGNYIIEGNRKTKVDGEDQTITLRGVIRTADIRPDNSIYSYNIMDLELSVEGEGNATKMQKPGLFTRFFRMLF